MLFRPTFCLLSALVLGAALSPVWAGEPLRGQQVVLRAVDRTLAAEATVEAVRQATVAAQVNGRVLEVRVDAGSRVKAGEVLMRIDSREAAEGAAAAQAQLIQAQAQYERTRSLMERKFVSAAALDKAEADYKAAKAMAAQAGVGAGYGTITAPMSGVVGLRLTEMGEMAAPGKPLMTVFDPRSLRVTAAVPQQQLAEMKGAKSGLKARIEFTENGKWLDAVRVEVLPTVDGRTHTATVRAYLADNTEGVVPGAFARLHLVTGKAEKLLVPAGAVVRRGEVTLVYVLDGQGQPRLRQVRLGETMADGIEVLAGIASGETVALEPVKAGMAAVKK
ncbi:efflux RND transporter periplasmic adaptor subunit [Denitratisoma sp. agr-D3]